MAFRIGFSADSGEERGRSAACAVQQQPAEPRKSVVQVSFPGRGMDLAYYNDRFDLHRGDWVYVDGKLEGQRGRVTEVNYNFKIRLADYKRVIAVLDTHVEGQFYMAGSHFVTFDPSVLPAGQVALWLRGPAKEEDEFVSGNDDSSFQLDDLSGLHVSGAIAERGHTYYLENRVRYLSLDGSRGYALVEGSKVYELEFSCRNGEIRDLTCGCLCSCACKHEFAAMLQLRETLDLIEKHYADAYRRSGAFSAIDKGTLFSFAIAGRETGSFIL